MWRRFAVNASVLTVSAALEEARDELADPVSDRVIETFMAAHERGQSVVVDVLRTLADDVTKDLQLNEQIITGQTEVRAQAVVAALLPFFVLLLLVSSNDGFRDFYRIDRRVRGDLHRRRHGVARLEADQRDRSAPRGPPRPGAGADEGRVVNGQVLAIAVLAAVAAWLPRSGRDAQPGPARRAPRPVHGPGPRPTRHGDRRDAHRRPGRCGGRWSPPSPTVSAGALGSGSTSRAGAAAAPRRTGHDDRGRRTGAANSPTRSSGSAIGVSLALLLRLNTTLALVVAGIGGGVGAIRMRAKVDGLIDDRQTVMRAEAHTVCQMLAVWLRTGDTPAGALDRLAHRTNGIVPGELAEASAQIRSGAPPADVLERLATQTAEPSAARLYRLYGATWSAGGDPASLLALSDSLRASRRDAIARTMARRRIAMAFPLVAVIAPILILFIAAALPSIVFGR